MRWLVIVVTLGGCRTQPLDIAAPADGGGAPPPDLLRVDLTRIPDFAFPTDLPRRVDLAIPFDLSGMSLDLKPGDEVNAPRGPFALWCNGTGCADQYCCVADDGSQTCASGCSSQTTAFSCDDPQDCTGAICCLDANVLIRRTACTLSCSGLAVCKATTDCGPGTICRRLDGLPDNTGVCLAPD